MTDEDHHRARFVAVYLHYKGTLLARAASLSTSPHDLLQTGVLKAWTWFRSNPCANDDLLRAMLFKFIEWTATDEGRRRQRSPITATVEQLASEDGDPFEVPDENAPLPAEVANHHDLAALIGAAQQRLDNAEMRTVLELRYTDPEPSFREIAEKMGISEDKAKQLHHRAKEALTNSLLSLAKEMNISTDTQRHES